MGGELFLLIRLALALLLFAFLGYTLLTIWRDIRLQSEVLASRQSQPITLLRMTANGRVEHHYFSTSEVTIGRDPTCDCLLDDRTVSTNHARLSYHHNQWWVEDLGSRNGTYLNSEFISTPTVITSSDELRFGEVACTVDIGERHEHTHGKIEEISSV
jgi:pSer/pThr/pTyr-binding forkhead associated (FHA) protein